MKKLIYIIPLIFISVLLYAVDFREFNSMASASGIIRPPQNVSASTAPRGAKISWEYSAPPDTSFSHNTGQPHALWLYGAGSGMGVLFDVSGYTGGTLEEIDFYYIGGWNRDHLGKPPVGLSGPYKYMIHIYNITDMDGNGNIKSVSTIYKSDTLFAPDAYNNTRVESAVKIGSITIADTMQNIGVFVQPLTTLHDSNDNKTYAWPALFTDNGSYVQHVNYMCINFDDPNNVSDPNYSNVYELKVIDYSSTNILLDLWINRGQGKNILASPKSVNENSFSVFRGTKIDSMQKIASVSSEAREFIDLNAPADSTYLYAVSSVIDTVPSIMEDVEYSNPVFPLLKAREDNNSDFVPDRLGEEVQVRGIINSPNFSTTESKYYLQDESGGLYLSSENFCVWLNTGDYVYAKGVIAHENGLTTIVPNSQSHVTLITRGVAVDTIEVGGSENLEDIESMLVFFDNVSLVNPASWPSSGSSDDVLFTTGEDTFKIHINQFTDLPGWTPPAEPFKLVSIVDQYTDKMPADNGYRLRPRGQSDFLMATAIDFPDNTVPRSFALNQNFPNPFNPSTVISYQLASVSNVRLIVYNTLGQEVTVLVNELQQSGKYQIQFNAQHLANGLYFYRLRANDFISTKKMILMK